MKNRTALHRALATTLAAGAIVAAPAVAKPVDRIDRYEPGNGANVTPIPRQDLSSPDTRDLRPLPAPGQPVWPIEPQPLIAPTAPDKAHGTSGTHGDDGTWFVLGLGLAGAGVAAGGAAIARRSRVRASRVAA